MPSPRRRETRIQPGAAPHPRAAAEDSEREDGQRPLGPAVLSSEAGAGDAGGSGPRVGGERGGPRPAQPEEAARPWGVLNSRGPPQRG